MAIRANSFRQLILKIIADGKQHTKRSLLRNLRKHDIDTSYLAVDMALASLRESGLVENLDTSIVQITHQGQKQTENDQTDGDPALDSDQPIMEASPEWNYQNAVEENESSENEQATPKPIQGPENRIAIFGAFLEEAGKPLHYVTICDRALRYLPPDQRFSWNDAYDTLQSSEHFVPLANGFFDLAARRPAQKTESRRTQPPTPASVPSPRTKRPPRQEALLETILKEAGGPLHCTIIHERALSQLPPDEHFTLNQTYVMLRGDPRFMLVRDGVFELVDRPPAVNPAPRRNERAARTQSAPRRRQRTGSRAELFANILEEAGEPLHYTVIHQRALAQLPPSRHFSANLAYISLHGSNRFVLLGNGLFALANSTHVARPYTIEDGQRVFDHCPAPLLPDEAHVRALFDSVIASRHYAQRHTFLTGRQFLEYMQEWAKQPTMSNKASRNAFHAWYVLGVCDYMDYPAQASAPFRLTISPEATLKQVRIHCLNSLCQRLRYTTTILHLVRVIHHATPERLQNILRDQEGYRTYINVADYFDYLAAFEALQRNGDGWRLTPIGEKILAAHPPQNLPDLDTLGETMTGAQETGTGQTWDEQLGLLDL